MFFILKNLQLNKRQQRINWAQKIPFATPPDLPDMTAVLKDGGEGEGGLAEQGLRAAGGDRLMTKLQSEANLFITIHTQTQL